jgi:BirA family biotin operon repressor/biotin-[acetyl-CoA-carboxylase] ligase
LERTKQPVNVGLGKIGGSASGRGRRGRAWLSPPGQNLLFSFLWRGSPDPRKLASFGMAAAAGVAAFLAEEGMDVCLKWPNDVWIDGAKIAGVLVETTADPEGAAAVVGIGLNVNLTSEDAARVGAPATSIFLQTGREWNVETALERLSPFLEQTVGDWEADGFDGVKGAWERLAWRAPGDRIRVGDGAPRREGRFAGYGEFGELLLETEDAGLVAVWAGDAL